MQPVQNNWGYFQFQVVRTAYELGEIIRNTLEDHIPSDLLIFRNHVQIAFNEGLRGRPFPYPRVEFEGTFSAFADRYCVACNQPSVGQGEFNLFAQ